MNKVGKTLWALLGTAYVAGTIVKNVELYKEKINPLENEFRQICEEVVEEYGIPIPTEVLNSKNGPLNDLVAQREQLIKEYNAKDRGSSWFLKYYGADLETGIYLWHPFHKID
ncbi:hypothetical protein HN865_00205 [Candidatus Woesearchaeota archaeon]|jgi:hypothetical protein|nr:hypothetical protein [Candidatus Woesearchaeota archaeon]MBT7237263.1 hypothetical protein [Candidatus Woesearchaeota archaeon]